MNNNETEINLISLMIYCMERWRSIIAISLVVMLLGGLYGAVKTKRANENLAPDPAAVAEVEAKQKEIADTEETEYDREPKLEEPDRETFEYEELETEPVILNASQVLSVDKALDQAENYYSLKSWAENSPYLRIDSDAVNKAGLVMAVSPATNQNLLIIKEAYKSLADSPEAINYILDKTGLEVSDDQLISVSDDSSAAEFTPGAVFVVNILWPEKEGCGMIADALSDFLASKTASLASVYGTHSLSKISGEISTSADYNLKMSQISYNDSVRNVGYDLTSMRCGFIREQFELYIERLDGCDWDTKEEKAIAITQLEALTEKMEEPPVPASLVRKGIKNAVIGLFLGIFLSAGTWAVIYVVRNRADWSDEFGYSYRISGLGKIPPEAPAKEFVFDRWIRNWKYHDTKNTKEEALKLGATEIALLQRKEDFKEVALVSAADEFDGNEIMELLQNAVGSFTEKPLILPDILNDTVNMKNLAEADCAVILVRDGVTRRRELYQLIELLKRQDKKVLGGVMIAEAK